MAYNTATERAELRTAILHHVERHDLFDEGKSDFVTDAFLYDLKDIWNVKIDNIKDALAHLIYYEQITRHDLNGQFCYRLTAEQRNERDCLYVAQNAVIQGEASP